MRTFTMVLVLLAVRLSGCGTPEPTLFPARRGLPVHPEGRASPLPTVPVSSKRPPSAKAEPSTPGKAQISKTTRWCLTCHISLTPGIVDAWRASTHARVTPREGKGKTELERRMSATDVPEALQDVVVGCYECHGLRPEKHGDAFPHNGQTISVVVSPDDCAVCHAIEAEEFGQSKKAHAWENLSKNPVFMKLAHAVTSVKGKGSLASTEGSTESLNASCGACHGRPVTVTGTETVERGLSQDFPVLSNWPNQGVGRINPDGSKGACTACHPRHKFSVETARKPHTCSQCHLEPDFPAWNVWRESKHGNLVLSHEGDYDWTAVPWVVGRDFQAPSCAACHVSLVTRRSGAVLVRRSHRFDDRLWLRLNGLTHATAQTKSGATHTIRNAEGQPLPSTFDGRPATAYLIDRPEQDARRSRMEGLCVACHATPWVRGHWARLDRIVAETNEMVTASHAYVRGDWVEDHDWIRQWLFHGNSIRYGTAMGGPDHVSFKKGWWDMNATHARMKDRGRPNGR